MVVKRRSARPLGKFFLIVCSLCFLLIGEAAARPGNLRPPIARAQDDPAAAINRLAEAVHIQNLRTGNTTRWLGGDLGRLDGTEINAPAGTVFNTWTFTDLNDESRRVSVADMRRPVVMNIWASWCGPCRFEFPFLAEIAKSGATNYDLWFVNAADEPSAARRFLRSQPEGLSVYVDRGDAFITSIGLQVFPTTLLVDTDGAIILAHSGIVTKTVMNFFNAVAANPRLGSLDAASLEIPALVATIAPVDPATATPVVYGQQVAGELTNEAWQHNYRFEGKAGDEVTIDMKSTEEDLDPYLVLIGPNGQRIAENDDGPEWPYAQIALRLPADGTYVVVATRFLESDGYSIGGYNLVVATANQSGAGANTILLNVPVSSRLTRDVAQATYLIDAAAGQRLTFTLEHDLPEETLRLEVRLGPTDRLIPYQPTENGLLVAEVEIPQDGSYSVYVSRSMSSRVGPITFTLTVAETGAPPATDDAADDADTTTGDDADVGDSGATGSGDDTSDFAPAVMNYGDTVSGVINDAAPALAYEFEGKEGETVTISLTAVEGSGDLDTQVALLGPTGSVFAANDDADVDTTDSEIANYRLPADGTYTIVASRFQGGNGVTSGDFTLTLTNVQPTVAAPPLTPITPAAPEVGALTVTYGEAVPGALDSQTFEQRMVFTGQQGDVVTITLQATSGDLDPYLRLLDSAGNELAFNDDDLQSGTRDAAIRRFRLPADGTYTLIVTRYGAANGSTSGSYELLITEENTAPIARLVGGSR